MRMLGQSRRQGYIRTGIGVLGAATCLAVGAPASAQVTEAPTDKTRAIQAEAASTAPPDNQDATFAHHGFIATLDDPKIRGAKGRVVYDLSSYAFLKSAAPATVNPLLWRHQQLMAVNGLFQVADRIWQVRGFDAANISFVKGDHGWIVLDTLGNVETARAALDLVNSKLGQRPIAAIVYTHPHIDNFGGAAGLISPAQAAQGQIPILAPKGFMAAALRETVVTGPAVLRRSAYQFGFLLPRGPEGEVGIGIGPEGAFGTPSLIPPNREIDRTGDSVTIDGVTMVFQVAHDTESPVELHVDFPQWRVVYMAEDANPTQHNILAPRGATVRNAKAWADALTQSIHLFGDSNTLIASHGRPRFGRAVITDFLAKQRDYYAFLNDQTIRLINDGLTGDEIAAQLRLPVSLQKEWYEQPFYGSLSFNTRAVYQFYMGFYDGNPAHLAPMPPAEAGRRYVAAMGGSAHVRQLAESAFDSGDYSWAAELLNRAVFADPADSQAKGLLERCYDQLGWTSENAVWRNEYLNGAKELRNGVPAAYGAGGGWSFAASTPTPDFFNMLATRLDPAKAEARVTKVEIVFPERSERTYVTVEDGVLLHQPGDAPGPVDATVTVPRAVFAAHMLGFSAFQADATDRQDAAALAVVNRLASLLEKPRVNFPIVTPGD